jgi:hypothetical protein
MDGNLFDRVSRIASGSTSVLGVARLLLAGLIGSTSPGARPAAGGGLGPGCAPERPAQAHRAGGVPATGEETLVPCVAPTGWRTSEVGVVVTNSGSVLFQPAMGEPPTGFPLGVLRSDDRGGSWDFIAPPSEPEAPEWNYPFDANLGIDRQSGRVFQITPGYYNLAGTPPAATYGASEKARVVFSDDDGRTWATGGDPLMRMESGDADKIAIFAGPAPAAFKDRLDGYPNVVYNCAGHKPLRCQSSLDGGLTWQPVADLPFPDAVEPHQGPLRDCSDFGLNGVVGPDGTAYMGYAPCNRAFVGVSRDAGASWEAVQVADVELIGYGNLSVGVDEAGNVYASWVAVDDRLPYLSISRDSGRTWSRPLMVGAPGVTEAALPRVVGGAAGQVAVSYFGSTDSPGKPFPAPCKTQPATSCPEWAGVTWGAYITESFNSVDPDPLFWSATVNDPAHPVWYGCSPSGIGVIRLDESAPYKSGTGYTGGCAPGASGLAGRQDYFGMDMAPDNTPWIGFGQACPNGLPVPGNPYCPAHLTGALSDESWGMVGRLVRHPAH